ncbi:MAG: response regulator transcription factor [Burkholderiaceae bacterium]|nr:response regulator transcription factor [Burkholderiaceae bacterium]
MTITLVLADDHPLVLNGLRSALAREPDMTVLACCTDGPSTLHAVDAHRPDILLLDVKMPRMDGLQVMRALAGRGLPTRVILLAAELRRAQLDEAERLGVRGVMLKDAALSTLLHCVRAVDRGSRWPEHGPTAWPAARPAARPAPGAGPAAPLTERELQVALHVARGLRNREIARELAIGEGTVKLHLHHAYRKLRVGGRLALSVYVRDNGLA